MNDTFYVPLVPRNDPRKLKQDVIAVSVNYMKKRGGFYVSLYLGEKNSTGCILEITCGRYIDIEPAKRNSDVKRALLLGQVQDAVLNRAGPIWDHVVKFANDKGLAIAEK